MPWPKTTQDTIKRLKNLKRVLKDLFTGRDLAVDLLVLAAVSQEHLLLIGPPGTAKTELVSRFTELIDARGFHYLLTRFSEPSELFGPLDLEAFREEGRFHIRTQDMLPDAEIAFLDEVFQASSAILNTLLTLVNERVYHNGAVRQPVPLISLLGASNSLPDDPELLAFADRFALRLHVDAVAEERLDALLDHGWQLERERIKNAQKDGNGGARTLAAIKLKDLLGLNHRLLEVELKKVRPAYSDVIRELRAEGIELSDRRVVKGLKLVAAAALLREATTADPQDLWPLNHVWSRPEEAETLRRVVQPRVVEAGGQALELGRPLDEILGDLAVLQDQEPTVRGEVALGAHLMALNRLRRELLRDHREHGEVLKQTETTIQRTLMRLEGAEELAHV